MATLYKNGEKIMENSAPTLLAEIADPVTESYMFDAAITELQFLGEFEWVQDNDVYLIKVG